METKFKEADVVYERINPDRKLVIGQFRDGLYYCHFPENRKRLFVYQERELMLVPLAPTFTPFVSKVNFKSPFTAAHQRTTPGMTNTRTQARRPRRQIV